MPASQWLTDERGDVIRTAVAGTLLLVTVLVGAGCGDGAPQATSGETPAAEKVGDVIANEGVSDLDPSLQSVVGWAQRFTYISQSGINEGITHVTGMLLVPKGEPPPGGWQLVAFGHPATGSLPGCAPTASPTLLNSAPVVQALLQANHPVVISDYQGLGKPRNVRIPSDGDAYHPYLDSTSTGYNLIDSVRAGRTLIESNHGTASESWLAFGIGQGGQASWAANEQAVNHGYGLKLLGSVAISPAADINGLADGAEAGTLNTQQSLDLLAFLAALNNEYGKDFNLADYRGGIVEQKWDVLLACQGQALEKRSTIAGQITPDDLRPRTPAAAAILRGYLQKTSLPQGPTEAPMLVTYGEMDPLVPAAWTERALDEACRMGDVITIRRLPGDAPDQLDMAGALDWIAQRANGVPAPNDCQGRAS